MDCSLDNTSISFDDFVIKSGKFIPIIAPVDLTALSRLHINLYMVSIILKL